MTHECSDHNHCQEIPPGSEEPSTNLNICTVYRGVRDDVCSWCMNLASPGRVWSTHIVSDDDDSFYLTFCNKECREQWRMAYDEESEQAFLEAAHFVRSYQEVFEAAAGEADRPPTREEVLEAWETAYANATRIVSCRVMDEPQGTSINVPAPGPAYATLLFYLLEATIFAMRNPMRWQTHVAELRALENGYAYPTHSSLINATAVYVHLCVLLPMNVLLSGAFSSETVEAALLANELHAESFWSYLEPVQRKGKKRAPTRQRRAELVGFGIYAPINTEEAENADEPRSPARNIQAWRSYLAAWGVGQF